MRFGFVGSSYTSRSPAIADEEAINLFAETVESQGSQVASKAYGGASATSLRSFYGTPGTVAFTTLPGATVRGMCYTGTRMFAVSGTALVEVLANGSQTPRGSVASDGAPVSIAVSNIQILIVSGGSAYCYTLATNVLLDVTAQLVAVPIQVDYSDGYFIVAFKSSNKFQMSGILDGTTWPGLQVNAVSVFPENVVSIIVNHRELWVFGARHCQPYGDTGSDNIFDVIPGSLIEAGCGATFATSRLDNTVLWVSEDERGARGAWRASGYTPQRVSTHAVEAQWAKYATVSDAVAYSYQDGGHLFWCVYFPSADCTWVYDVAEGMWHKRAAWVNGVYEPHHSQNHVYAFGKHLVGDWKTGKIFELSMNYLDDAGSPIRRLRRSPTVSDEMGWITHVMLTVDFETGVAPQPPLTDGNGNPRAPQAMLRWSDDRGHTWSNEHDADCGQAGQYKARVIWRRLGRSRYRVYELTFTDPVSIAILDAYLETGA